MFGILYQTCEQDKTVVICFVGATVTKLYSVLFSTFWMLFISSFIDTQIDTPEDAKKIYSSVMLVSVVLGVVTIPLVGKYADTFNP